MSDNGVELTVRSALAQVIAELEAIREKADETNEAFKKGGQDVGENLQKNVKKTEEYFGSLRNLSRRVADQMRGDFKSLLSINALKDAAGISNQFRKNISETVDLSNTIRKLGVVFGIVGADFSRFQTKITEGLGDLGLSSDVASSALSGLSQTQVRGEDNLVKYSQQAGMLASVGRVQGSEGDIAGGMARVIQARGGDVNDTGEMTKLAEDLRRVMIQTGSGPMQTLNNMERIFEKMPDDLRKSLGSGALANLAVAAKVGGPGSTDFLQELLTEGSTARLTIEGQGGKDLVDSEGLNIEKLRGFIKEVTQRVGGDKRLGAQSLNLSKEAAEGFVRLGENLDKVAAAQDRVKRTTGDLTQQYRASMGLGEAFAASVNRVKSALAKPLSAATQGATDALSKAAETPGGAAAVTIGGGVVAALLAGFGARGLGSVLTTAAKTQGAEKLLGEKTMPVYVTNAGEIGAAGGLASSMGVMGVLGKAGIIGAVGTGAYFGLDALLKGTAGENEYGDKTDFLQDFMLDVGRVLGLDFANEYDKQGKHDGMQANMTAHANWNPVVRRPNDPGMKLVPTPPQGAAPPTQVNVKTAGQPGTAQQRQSGGAFPDRPIKVQVELSKGLSATVTPTRGGRN